MKHTYQQGYKHELRAVHYNMRDIEDPNREGQDWWKLMCLVYQNTFLKNSDRSPRGLLRSVYEKGFVGWEIIHYP